MAPEQAVAADPPAKQPPPEKAADARRRSLVVLSFWLVVVVLGLPIWWRTTTIYRADLPLDRMLQWAEGKACRPVFPLQIAVDAPSLAEHEARHLMRLTQHALDDVDDFSVHHLRLQLAAAAAAAGEHEPALTMRLSPGPASSATLSAEAAVLDVVYAPNAVPPLGSGSSALAALVAAELRAAFAEERAMLSYLLSTSSMASAVRAQAPSGAAAEALARRTTKSLRYAPTYHLTFSLLTDGAAPSSWDVEAALEAYVRPVLAALAPIHDFTVDTQVQLYATPGVQATVLGKEHLASFLNAAEWPLSPSMGGAPTVNFVVFVGNQTIGGAGREAARSWTIPQWGTVYLLAQPATATHVARETLRRPMLTFAAQLLSLLGMPAAGPLPLRLGALARIRATDLLVRASSSLGSLARLSRALASISIPRSVADGVAATLEHLDAACAALGGPDGLRHARVAEAAAEGAFFEKSMVGQLYFPDEHKIAVYLPLLGPVGVPLVLGLVHELRAWLRRRRRRRQEAAVRDVRPGWKGGGGA